MESKGHSSQEYKSRIQTFRDDRNPSFGLNQSASMNGGASAMIRRTLPKSRVPRVCVVGAGVSGLRCADVLSGKGMEVTVVEARDRIGGRVSNCPREIGSKLIEARFTKVIN